MKHRSFTQQDIALLEQGFQSVIDHVVPGLAAFYKALLKEGFTSQGAIDLTRSYMTMLIIETEPPPPKDDPPYDHHT